MNPIKPMTLSQLIKLASDAYAGDMGAGLVELYHTHPNENHGDTLAKFIAIELAETFDPEASEENQRELAAQQLERAVDELQSVIDALSTN